MTHIRNTRCIWPYSLGNRSAFNVFASLSHYLIYFHSTHLFLDAFFVRLFTLAINLLFGGVHSKLATLFLCVTVFFLSPFNDWVLRCVCVLPLQFSIWYIDRSSMGTFSNYILLEMRGKNRISHSKSATPKCCECKIRSKRKKKKEHSTI